MEHGLDLLLHIDINGITEKVVVEILPILKLTEQQVAHLMHLHIKLLIYFQ